MSVLLHHKGSPGFGRRAAILAVAASLLLAACGGGGGGGEGSSAPAEFRIAIGIDPDTLDPAGQTTTTVQNIVDYMVDTLVDIDKDGKLKPGLATDWEVAPDGLSITLTLRQGVTFHDGTPFNAEAVKFSLDRVLDPNVTVPIRGSYTVIQEVEVVDDYTVRLHLSQPSPALMAALSTTMVGIISPASVEEHGNTYTNYQHPVGTGPYVFKEYVPGERVVVEKNPDYWGEEPYYDRVIFQVVPEAATRMSQLLSGQVDMIILPPVSDIPSLQQNPNVEVLLAPSNRTIYIAINNNDEVLSDKRVRQALNYAVDKDAIIQNVLFGAATKLDAPMAPSLFGYCPVGAYEYNPDRARQLLAEAGVENLTLDFIAPTGRYVQDFQAAEAIAGYLEDVGINVTLRTMDWPTYVQNIQQPPDQNDLDLHLLGWAPGYLDAQEQMVQFQLAAHPPNGLATAFYTNPEVEDLLERASREIDVETRADLYCQASRLIMDDAPWIFLWYQSFPIVYSKDVTGVSYLPNEMFDAVYARPAN